MDEKLLLADSAEEKAPEITAKVDTVSEGIPAPSEECTETILAVLEDGNERDSDWDEIVLAEDDFSEEQTVKL